MEMPENLKRLNNICGVGVDCPRKMIAFLLGVSFSTVCKTITKYANTNDA